MTDITVQVGTYAGTRTKTPAKAKSTDEGIAWYSWLGGFVATAIIFAAMVYGQDFPLF